MYSYLFGVLHLGGRQVFEHLLPTFCGATCVLLSARAIAYKLILWWILQLVGHLR